MVIEKGTLWQRLAAATERAQRVGALQPVPTRYTFVEENGIFYFVRVLESLKRKDEARKKQEGSEKSGKNINPFLPPEPDLTVGEITESHIAVLNKFNVLENHLLIVTREFEDQDTLLTLRDFEALWLCMAEYGSLGFYNGGREAGASQQHKHLQIVPLPLAPEGPAVPVEPLFPRVPSGVPAVIPGFPFLHSYVRLDGISADASDAARNSFELYGGMLKRTGIHPPVPGRVTRHSMPYCLLAARGWMLLVPRCREFFENISLNSLAFAGSFFVRDEDQLARLKAHGIMKALREVTVNAVSGENADF